MQTSQTLILIKKNKKSDEFFSREKSKETLSRVVELFYSNNFANIIDSMEVQKRKVKTL